MRKLWLWKEFWHKLRSKTWHCIIMTRTWFLSLEAFITCTQRVPALRCSKLQFPLKPVTSIHQNRTTCAAASPHCALGSAHWRTEQPLTNVLQSCRLAAAGQAQQLLSPAEGMGPTRWCCTAWRHRCTACETLLHSSQTPLPCVQLLLEARLGRGSPEGLMGTWPLKHLPGFGGICGPAHQTWVTPRGAGAGTWVTLRGTGARQQWAGVVHGKHFATGERSPA